MERFYVLEADAYLKKSGNNLVVTRGAEKLAEIPLQGLQQLTLVGYTSLSGAALDALIRNRVETVLLSPRGQFRARLMVDEHKHVQRRQAQYLRLADPAFTLETARAFVAGKLRSSARLLALRGAHYEDPELTRLAAQIKGLESLLSRQQDLEVVRGIEGHGANLYYQGFPRLLRTPGFVFRGRTRRPPLDPVNALLSFVYTLLTNEVLTAVKTAGLDPYLGALHVVDYGRPSLACDLVEEWRAFLGDRLVLSLLNRKVISPEDFVQRAGEPADPVDEEALRQSRPVEMKPKVCRALLQTYERWMASDIRDPESRQKTDYRGLIHRQVKNFRRYLLGELDRYQPFAWSSVK